MKVQSNLASTTFSVRAILVLKVKNVLILTIIYYINHQLVIGDLVLILTVLKAKFDCTWTYLFSKRDGLRISKWERAEYLYPISRQLCEKFFRPTYMPISAHSLAKNRVIKWEKEHIYFPRLFEKKLSRCVSEN